MSYSLAGFVFGISLLNRFTKTNDPLRKFAWTCVCTSSYDAFRALKGYTLFGYMTHRFFGASSSVIELFTIRLSFLKTCLNAGESDIRKPSLTIY